MKKVIAPLLLLMFVGFGCDQNGNFVLFSVQDDIKLGQQVKEKIENDPNYHILYAEDFPELYKYLYNIRDNILNSGEIAYRNEFPWEVHVIKDDNTLNAFATPGGYIYIYTGLIKYLDKPDALAGVLAHEMAHADERHTIRSLQKMYGVDLLLSVALGNDPSTLAQVSAQIAGTLAGLSFSRQFEEEADAHSVEYLSHTQYACNGAALFFIKMDEQGNSEQPPEFLSTHPNPGNRIEAINEKAASIGCDTTLVANTNYNAIRMALP